MKGGILLSEPDVNTLGSLAVCTLPGMSSVNGLAILLEPSSKRLQTFHLHRRNRAIRLRANIEQKISILAHDIYQQVDQFIRSNGFSFSFGPIVAK